ncbi:MAG: phage tail tape measure protein, partial [Ruminococcaceae bacterium]|nr:phage tail tape measure protein [Oscillospiraceae bacterium]
ALAAAGVAKTVKEIADELLACADAAASFETAMAKVSTLAGPENLAGIKAQLVELSGETGVAVGSLAEAAYQAMSAGVDAADAVDFVATATKTSVAGFTDSATAVDVLTTALNAYKLEGSEAERVASMLVKTQDEGKTSVGELAQNMGRVIPVASAYNVSLGNLSTAYALLTKSGTNTAIATTNLSAMFTELAKDGSTVADVLQKQTGKSFTELMAEGENLGEVMAILADSVDGDATAFSNLWSSTTAGQAALSLLNSGAEEFTRTLAVMESSSGSVDRNFQTMADTTEFAQQRMVNAAENLRIAIGDQLNPALEKLYDAGADAFTWATDFVEDHPWVVSAVTGLTTALGALAIGAAGLAVAETAIGALGAALAALSAQPIVLVAGAIIGLVTAIGTYCASVDDGTADTKEFTKSLKESKAAYEDLMDTIAGRQTDLETLVATLERLLGQDNKTDATKNTIKQIVDELNEALPELGLVYDDVTDSINLTTKAIRDMADASADQDEYNAKMERLRELQIERTDITERLKEAEEALAEAQKEVIEPLPSYFDIAADYNAALEEGAEAASAQQAAVDELTATLEANAAEIAVLEAETNAYLQQQADAAAKTEAMTATMGGLIDQMKQLEAEYAESYQSAYDSISGQIGLFEEMDGKAKTTIDSLIETLEGQVSYLDDYAANIQKAMEMGVDEGLIKQLSDGSQESAQILAAIVEGGEDKVTELNEQFARVQEGKETFCSTVEEMEKAFDQTMADVVSDLDDAIKELDSYEELYQAGINNVQGLIDGTLSMKDVLMSAYEGLGLSSLAAYKRPVRQQSPSKEFAKIGSYDVQGLIQGAEAEKANLSAAYENLAKMAMESYAAGVLNNADKIAQALDEVKAAFQDFEGFVDLKSSVGDLEYQLWERTDGKNASDVEKYARQLKLLEQQQKDQAEIVKAAAAEYEAAVKLYGEGTAGSLEYQKALLEEKLAWQDLLDEIEKVSAAKQKAAGDLALLKAQVEWYNSGLGRAESVAKAAGYITPQEVAQIANLSMVTPDGRPFDAAYEQASQDMMASMARSQPTHMEAPSVSERLEQQMEAMTAGMVNAISGIAQNGSSPIVIAKVMVPDGRVLAETTFNDLVDYGDANGTPILNPRW